MTMQEDNRDSGFLYVASKSGGLKVYSIADTQNIKLVKQIKGADIDNLSVMNVHQNGNYLYLSLGDYFTTDEPPGLAIVDVTDPQKPTVTDFWTYGIKTEGTGMIVTNGDYAYMAAMAHGLIILNIKDKSDIKFESALVPDLDFPQKNADLTKINSRGLVYENGLIYMAYDAGGVRIIDVTDPKKPVERGKYSNPLLNGRPRAYNNVVLHKQKIYVTFDYCGLEVLDVSDTGNIKQHSWWNPWGCPNNNWFTSRGHTNEIAIDTSCEIVFMSTGKSELYVVDISDPLNPDSLTSYGATDNNLGTWGVSRYKDRVYMSYICTLGIPFPGTWSGVKSLRYKSCSSTGSSKKANKAVLRIYPNPAKNQIRLKSKTDWDVLDINTLTGKTVLHLENPGSVIELTGLVPGSYILQVKNSEKLLTTRLLIQP